MSKFYYFRSEVVLYSYDPLSIIKAAFGVLDKFQRTLLNFAARYQELLTGMNSLSK